MTQSSEIDTSERPADDVIAHRLTFLLHRLVSALIDAASPEFRDLGLSIPAARTIVSLLESGAAATVGSLAETTCIDLSTMSHILRRLESQQLVRRQRQDDDNRVVVAVLTEQGRSVAETCRSASLRHEDARVHGMSASEVAQFKSALERSFENARLRLGA